MNINALAVANYLIKIANERGEEIRPLRLMKLVYFAHGFSLALLDRPLLDSRFDVVEAWRYGPVIPSVYHTFKYLKKSPITTDDYAVVINALGDFEVAELKDEQAQQIARFVLERYKNYSDSDLVSLTHREGTPWSVVYVPNQNKPIPDEYTKYYYNYVVKQLMEDAK